MKSEITVQVRLRRTVLCCGILAAILKLDRLSDWLIDRCVIVVDA